MMRARAWLFLGFQKGALAVEDHFGSLFLPNPYFGCCGRGGWEKFQALNHSERPFRSMPGSTSR